jgi:hypothetical protein
VLARVQVLRFAPARSAGALNSLDTSGAHHQHAGDGGGAPLGLQLGQHRSRQRSCRAPEHRWGRDLTTRDAGGIRATTWRLRPTRMATDVASHASPAAPHERVLREEDLIAAVRKNSSPLPSIAPPPSTRSSPASRAASSRATRRQRRCGARHPRDPRSMTRTRPSRSCAARDVTPGRTTNRTRRTWCRRSMPRRRSSPRGTRSGRRTGSGAPRRMR